MDSMRRYGLVQPVVVRTVALPASSGTTYRVVDGRRRIASARKLGMKRIKARVFESNGWIPDALTITLNEVRAATEARRQHAIQTLDLPEVPVVVQPPSWQDEAGGALRYALEHAEDEKLSEIIEGAIACLERLS